MCSPDNPGISLPVTSEPKMVLVGGASHVGKSTLCASLVSLPGWNSMSTDQLGRHPGRPWVSSQRRVVRQHVAEHYLSLSAEELVKDLLDFQRKMWPTIERIIKHRLTVHNQTRLAFEGSALLPENTGKFQGEDVKALCLAASPEFLQRRIHEGSRYSSLSTEATHLVDKFIKRNVLLNEHYVETAKANGVTVVDVEAGIGIEQLTELSIRHE